MSLFFYTVASPIRQIIESSDELKDIKINPMEHIDYYKRIDRIEATN